MEYSHSLLRPFYTKLVWVPGFPRTRNSPGFRVPRNSETRWLMWVLGSGNSEPAWVSVPGNPEPEWVPGSWERNPEPGLVPSSWERQVEPGLVPGSWERNPEPGLVPGSWERNPEPGDPSSWERNPEPGLSGLRNGTLMTSLSFIVLVILATEKSCRAFSVAQNIEEIMRLTCTLCFFHKNVKP